LRGDAPPIAPGAKPADIRVALEKASLAKATLTGIYER
jgi:hypothetical protein